MPSPNKWFTEPRRLLELFVLVNVAGLSLDIYLAHSVNEFRHAAEYLPLYFSLAAPVLLLIGLIAGEWRGYTGVWRDLGFLVGWLAVAVGLVGVILHLDSHFFYERTIKSLVYAAPFAAPLAYTGLGLLLIMNRMVASDGDEWGRWVVLMALGGFVGNFVFSLTDHAQNGFYHWTEWIPVVSSAFTVGFLTAPFATSVGRQFLRFCGWILVLQAGVGVLGFALHMAGNQHGPSPRWLDNIVHGAPPLAPLLFPNLALLAGLGLWAMAMKMPTEEASEGLPRLSAPAVSHNPQGETGA